MFVWYRYVIPKKVIGMLYLFLTFHYYSGFLPYGSIENKSFKVISLVTYPLEI